MSKIKVLVLPSDRTGVSKFRSVEPHMKLQELYNDDFHVDIVTAGTMDFTWDDTKFLKNSRFWCHAKNINALSELERINCHYFWHQEDDFTLTSKGIIWTYPGKYLTNKSICVLPEKTNVKEFDCLGICSDLIENYKND